MKISQVGWVLGVLAVNVAACAHGGGSPAPTAFSQSASGGPFALAVREGTRGVPGARVTIRAASSPDALGEGVLWQGVTNAAGEAHGRLSLRADQQRVAVTVQRTGYDGPYTDDSLRTTFGFFAPTAWIEVDVSALASLTIPVARRPR